MSWTKLAFYNLVVLLSILGALLLFPPVIYEIHDFVRRHTEQPGDPRARLPNYDGIPWAALHFREFSSLRTSYYDYFTWRRDDFSGETISIVDGLRATVQSDGVGDPGREAWFFGGSTTWGTGSDDASTFPSIFARSTGARATNFGESGYIARQSLALLANQYIAAPANPGNRLIVFYDGINDVGARCRREIAGLGTGRQHQIQTILRKQADEKWSFRRTFAQLQDFLVLGLSRLGSYGVKSGDHYYDCDSSRGKAQFIARSLVATWQQAQFLAEINGDRFLAILQPVAFFGSPNLEHIQLTDRASIEAARQYRAVYPLIIEYASKRGINFLDLSAAYDDRELLYIDCCHVSPNGHEILVPQILDGLNVMGLFR